MHSVDFVFVVVSLHIRAVISDGRGLIGWGKTMYHPTCAFACRGVIKGCPLLCTPDHGGDIFGMGHSTTTTPPDCYTSDLAFLHTMALCLDTYCPLSGSPPLSLLEDYWNSHLATGTVGNHQWQPSISYENAVAAAREDESRARGDNTTDSSDTDRMQHGGHQKIKRHDHGDSGEVVTLTLGTQSALPTIQPKQPLNVTSFIAEADWQKQYNGMMSFEINETGHSTFTIIVMLVSLFLPVVLSLPGFIPGLSRSLAWGSLKSMLIRPAVWGRRHRQPVAVNAGGVIIPTRGQSLYIVLISILNVIFLLAPYHMIQPQSTFASREEQEHSTIGNRAGVLALGNMIGLFVFSARNNVLLWVTDWSHSTYLLLHRWLGYWTIIHTVLHSIMLLEYYKKYGDYAMELAKPYWIWGIVGTVAVSAIWPTSLLTIRQKYYEVFLTLHHILTILFLAGFYYHIWYCYNYNWGYEIWAFIAIAIWAIDRLWRLARMALKGARTAVVSGLPGTDGEYLRIEIQGVHAHGVVYLCFPTLSWVFWENHPFSVASIVASGRIRGKHKVAMEPAARDPEKGEQIKPSPNAVMAASANPSVDQRQLVSTSTSFIVRNLGGVTAKLAARLAAGGGPLRLPVWLDGSYHSKTTSGLSDCASLICIAGGVGVTGVLPVLRSFHTPERAQLFWGVRKQGLVDDLGPEMSQLSQYIKVIVHVGKRMDIAAVLGEEIVGDGEKGPVGVVVCGPPSMSDEVRARVSELGRSTVGTKALVFVDEAFSW